MRVPLSSTSQWTTRLRRRPCATCTRPMWWHVTNSIGCGKNFQVAAVSIRVFSVRSEDNASDMASRNFYFALMDAKQRAAATTTGRAGPDIVQRCWNEIQAQRKGWRLGARKESIELSASEGVRHRDLGDDDVSPDSLWCDLDPMDRPSAQGHARRSFMDTESPSL